MAEKEIVLKVKLPPNLDKALDRLNNAPLEDAFWKGGFASACIVILVAESTLAVLYLLLREK